MDRQDRHGHPHPHGKTIQDIPQFPCLWQPSGPLSAFIENQRLASKLVDRFKYLINLLPFNYNNCNANWYFVLTASDSFDVPNGLATLTGSGLKAVKKLAKS